MSSNIYFFWWDWHFTCRLPSWLPSIPQNNCSMINGTFRMIQIAYLSHRGDFRSSTICISQVILLWKGFVNALFFEHINCNWPEISGQTKLLIKPDSQVIIERCFGNYLEGGIKIWLLDVLLLILRYGWAPEVICEGPRLPPKTLFSP